MFPISRVLEVLLYSVAVFIPWLLVTYYPFRTRLRFSPNVVAIFAAVLAVARIAFDLAAGLALVSSTTVLQIGLIGLYVLCLFLSVKAHPVELVLDLALVFVLALVSTTAARWLFGIVTTHLELWAYSWAYSLVLLALEGILVTTYFLLYESSASKNTRRSPAKFAAKAEPAKAAQTAPKAAAPTPRPEVPKAQPAKPQAPKSPAPSAARPTAPTAKPVAAAVPVPEVKAPLPTPSAPSTEHLLSMQFTSLNTRILESRQTRKDLRRQIDELTNCLDAQDYDRARAMLLAMRQQLCTTSYGSNAALSAPLDYYAHVAASNGITMDIDVSMPDDSIPSVDPSDLIVILGNLLDNALDACKSMDGPARQISVSVAPEGNGLRLIVRNTCAQAVRQSKSGAYLSSKYDGPGAGLQTVRYIAERYHGRLEVTSESSVFTARVTLAP